MNEPVRPSSAPTRSDLYNVACPDGPLTLNAQQVGPQIQDKVVALVTERLEYADAELQRLEHDRLLRKHALLIGRQHGQHSTRTASRAVAAKGNVSV
jgi:hypothetical protein